ncbi:MAG: class I SAM-dependent methyltransferase [Bacillota bacterium]|nr:class I SAM-dependent methyltransferase [Bacillota bacterium]
MNGLRPGGLELSRQLLANVHLHPGDAVLDLGCGRGESLALLREDYACCPFGLEPDAEHRAVAQARNPGIPILDGRAESLPFPDQSFHLVLAECVLSLCEPLEAALSEIRRVLKPGGTLLLSDVYARKEALSGGTAMLRRLYSLPQLEQALRQAGFSIRREEEAKAVLLQMLGQLILEKGPEEAYACLGVDACRLKQASPGYILITAEVP